ncbi:retrovirus-related pol polyprotein from transposon TNT 1-94 [Tanacetum coccineum]
MLAPKCSTYNGRPTFANTMYLKKAQSEKPCLYEIPYDKSNLINIFSPDMEETLTFEQESISKLNKDKVKPYDYTYQNTLYENFKPPSLEYLDQLAHIVQPILLIIDSECTKHMMGNLKLLCNIVEKYLGTVRFGNDQFAPILSYGDLVQENIMIKRVYYVKGLNHNLFSVGQFCDADLEMSSPTPICFLAKASPTQAWLWHRRHSHLNFDTINLLSEKDIVNGLPKLKYVKDNCSKGYRVYNKRTRLIVESIHINFDEIKELSKASDYDNSGPVPQLQKTSVHNSTELETHDHINEPSSSMLVPNVSPPANTNAPSLQELEFLFSPLFEEYFTADNQSVSKSSSLSDNSKQQDTQPTTNIQPTTEPITPTTNVNVEENNNDQAADAQIDENKFYNIFSTPVCKELESSTRNVDNSNMHTFYQRHQSEHRWTKDHPLEQVRGNSSKPVQTRRQLATDPEMSKGYAQEEGIDFVESFAPVARLEAAKYALEILKNPGMERCESIGTPLATKPKLDADLSGTPVDQTKYRSMIGSLTYLTSSRPDLVQAVCYCARYQARPTEKHLKEVKRIFRYLKGTINMGLWYPKDSCFELVTFSDAGHVGCINTRKSTFGRIQFLGDKLVNWMSKKQDCTAMSLAKAKYVALSASFAQVMWMRTQLKDYGFDYNKISLYRDSQSTIAISCNPCNTPVPSTSILNTTLSRNKLNVVSVSCQTNWYEMFDSSRTGGSGT